MRTHWKTLSIIGLQSLFIMAHAQPITVNSLSYSTIANQTRLQFDVTARSKYQVFTLNNPSRLVIDLQNAQLGGQILSQPPASHPLFVGVRYAKRNKGLRVVLDLQSTIDTKNFSISSNDDEHNLIVNVLTKNTSVQPAPVLPRANNVTNNKITNAANQSPVPAVSEQKKASDDEVFKTKSAASEPTTPKPDNLKAVVNQSTDADEDNVEDESDKDTEAKTSDETATPKPVEKPTTANSEIIEGKALLEVIINGENRGAQLVNLKKDDAIISADAFKEWRIKKELWSNQTSGVSLRSLDPHLQYTVDNNSATLNITATPDSFESQVLTTPSQYNAVIPADAVHPEPYSGFINYAVNAIFSQPKGFDALNVPLEIGMTAGQWFAFNSFNSNYTASNYAVKTTRSASYLQWEDREEHQKVTLGDFAINSPTLATGGSFGGILWQSNFRQYPQFDFMPSFGMDFNVQTPSHAELYVNDVKTKEWDLLPGNVSLPSVLSSGQGDAKLVLTDAYGRQQEITQPFYITQQLLKAGLHEFFYGLGAKHNFSNKLIDYGNSVLFGAHRYGFSDTFTAGAAFTGSSKTANAGISLTQSFFGNSLIDTAVAVSHKGSLSGYMAYQFSYEQVNLALSAGYLDQQYGDINIDANSLQKNKYRLQGSINYSIPFTSSGFGASFSESASWNGDKPTRNLSLFYRQGLFSTVNLNTQVNHNLATGDNVASMTLSYFPQTPDESDILHDHNFSYQANYDDKTHADQQQWQMQRQGGIGEGYNYTAALQKDDQKLSGSARYQYRDNDGIYTANYAQTEQKIAGNVSIAGSLVTANNEIYFARPITDSFAIVKVQGSEEDVPIYQDGAEFGVGNENKAMIIPTLQSRRLGKISIKPADMGLNVVADHDEQVMDVGVRSANVVEFTLGKFVAVEGHAYTVGKDGNKQYLEALPLEYTVKGKNQDSFVAKKGFFYLENVPTGEFTATVKRQKNDCILHLTIPKSDKVVVKLGDILCQ